MVDMRKVGELTERERLFVSAGMAAVAVTLALGIVFIQFFVLEDRLQLSKAFESGSSVFAVVRTAIPAFFVVVFVPLAPIGEFVISRLAKREFRPRNILTLLLLTGEVFVVGAALLTVFDLLFSSQPVLVQFPLMALTLSISLVAMAFSTRIATIQRYLIKTFEE